MGGLAQPCEGSRAHRHNQAILLFYPTYSIRGFSSNPLHEQDTGDPSTVSQSQAKWGTPLQQWSDAVAKAYKGN